MITASHSTRGSGPMRKVLGVTSVLALAAAAYLVGVYCGYKNLWPMPQVKMLLAMECSNAQIRTDRFGRLLAYPGKIEIPCPAQDDATAVLLVFGQSNATNYQGQRYQAVDDRVVNFAEGRCFRAASPLLGADGTAGESWTLLGNKLIRSMVYRTVVIVPAGVGATAVHRWAAGSDLNQMLLGVIRQMKPIYSPTAVLWHQGSTDSSLGTSEADYRSDLKSLIDTIRAEGVTAPFYVSKSSVRLAPEWTEDNPVTRAQGSLVDGRSIRAGPDTDHDVSALDRFDGLHFSARGQETFTDAWVRLLRDGAAGR